MLTFGDLSTQTVQQSDALCVLSFALLFLHFIMQMGRSAGFNLGGVYSAQRPQQQQQQQQQHAPVSSSGISFSGVNQDLLHLRGSDMFQSSYSSYHSQVC